MKTMIQMLWLVVVMTASGAFAAAGESYMLVKLMGYDKKPTMEIMSATEYKEFQKQVKLEQRYFQKALAQASKEWREDKVNKGISFPISHLAPRTITGDRRFSSQEKADAELQQFNEMMDKRDEREAKRNSRSRKAALDKEKEVVASRAAELIKVVLEDVIAKASEGPSEKGEKAPVQEVGGAKVGAGVLKGAAGKPAAGDK